MSTGIIEWIVMGVILIAWNGFLIYKMRIENRKDNE